MTRTIANESVFPIGLGCMNLSHAYGEPLSQDDGIRLLQAALELGVNHFDTATLYGFGKNETLVGSVLKPHRQQIFLASKCGMAGVDGKRVIDGRPETIKAQCDASLQRLQTDVIDLYYLHRWDKSVPIEDSVGALSDLVAAGKIRFIGLSEVSGATIRKAHQVHPITAVQNEYSLWSRNAEYGALAACEDIGANLVAFSPLARGFLTGKLRHLDALVKNDIRLNMPRFQEPNFSHNLKALQEFEALALQAGCTPAQLALAWLLAQSPNVIPIPGTRSIEHLTENIQAAHVQLSSAVVAQAGKLINQHTIAGNRYPEATLKEIDTEEI
ncbi:aldo/keto reductase [Paenalcaligenes hominis]|uniref:aldo/keto reductase n=1 Tax=Paenalcaligenes hominis TaxID=643674 RepID=UPI00352614F3